MAKKVYAAILVGMVATSAPSLGCSCIDLTLEQKIEQADAVFVGKVVRLEVLETKADGTDIVRATLEPLEVAKGRVGREVEIVTSNGCCYCAAWFDIAAKYLVFATGESGEMSTSTCSGGGRVEDSKDELMALGLESHC